MIKISIIIPTRNRCSALFKVLNSIEKQTLDQSFFEIIICDNNSTDKTTEIAQSFAYKFKHFKYIKTLQPGLHIGRNKGFQEARGEILVYIDDDIEAFPDWLFTINEVFKNKDIVLVGGKNLPKWEIPPPDWVIKMWEPDKADHRILEILSIIDLGNTPKEISPYFVFGCNFSVRKKIIQATKGFHPDGMPQELIEYRGDGESFVSAYVLKNKLKTYYHPSASVYHFINKERINIDYFRQRSFNQGISDSYTYIRSLKGSIFKKILSYLNKNLEKIIIFLKRKEKNKINAYHNIILKAHEAGFNFHQEKLKKNKQLQDWVLKDNYLN